VIGIVRGRERRSGSGIAGNGTEDVSDTAIATLPVSSNRTAADTFAGYEDESTDGYDDPYYIRRSPSPAHASGGAYYPPAGGDPAAAPAAGFTQHPNFATTNLAEPQYTPYTPPGYTAPPPGPPPNSAATANGFPPAAAGPEHVSAASRPGNPEHVVSPRHGEEGASALRCPHA
jgi:hypothetical protein